MMVLCCRYCRYGFSPILVYLVFGPMCGPANRLRIDFRLTLCWSVPRPRRLMVVLVAIDSWPIF